MNNNHKQKVYSVLDSLTQTELDNYIKERDINIKRDSLIDKLNQVRKPETQYTKIAQNISDDYSKVAESYYNLGRAWVIALVLECFYDQKYKINDLKEYLHILMDASPELKEMVYDCMKDF